MDRNNREIKQKYLSEPDLSVTLKNVRLPNPVMTASGTSGYTFELRDLVQLDQLGGFITKSITLEPRKGNPPQRTFETPAGMLNSIGLANVGLEVFCEEKIPLLQRFSIPVFVNVAGKTIDEYVAVSQRLMSFSHISGLEINISCPNVKEGGITFGTDPKSVFDLVHAVRQSCPDILLIIKLTPNVTDITVTARAAIDAGADVLSMVNTFLGMAINIHTRKPVLGARTGGLSGPAIKPMALYLVSRVYQEVAREANIPIIGMGGISSAQDAIEFILAGATAVSVGTQVLIHPGCLTQIIQGIKNYLTEYKIPSIRDITGSLE
ncbi:MAG: dihydroorotate dehydrogenase [Sedimentisphaerales bacterium]|nr:dihydroorotate dehydrogenase [Sedimentisphaerales bacterium]